MCFPKSFTLFVMPFELKSNHKQLVSNICVFNGRLQFKDHAPHYMREHIRRGVVMVSYPSKFADCTHSKNTTFSIVMVRFIFSMVDFKVMSQSDPSNIVGPEPEMPILKCSGDLSQNQLVKTNASVFDVNI